MSVTESTTAAVEALRHQLPEATPVVHGTDEAPGLWNDTGGRPAVRVECTDVDDIRTTVQVATDHGRQVSVWGGRRGVHGVNAGVGQIALDLRRMQRVRFDAAAGNVIVEGASTFRQVFAALPTDRVTATTANADVGAVGAALGGGYGPLTSRYGLVSDQLLGARVVLADGTVADAAPTADAELLWGLRGGGSGFGVVVEATFATHVLAHVLQAAFAVSLGAAARALLMVQSLLDEEPDELGVVPLFTAGPDGEPTLFLAVYWSGAPGRGGDVLRRLDALDGAQLLVQQLVPYARSLNPDEDALWPTGRHWRTDTCTIARIDEAIAHQLVQSARAIPGPESRLFLHDFHGAPTRVDPSATAFRLRRAHFVVATTGHAEPGDDAGAKREQAWVDETLARLAPSALPGGYVNFLPPTAVDRISAFYGESASRLAELKKRVDPDHRLGGVTGLPAAGTPLSGR